VDVGKVKGWRRKRDRKGKKTGDDNSDKRANANAPSTGSSLNQVR
jgi:hypothetical protein